MKKAAWFFWALMGFIWLFASLPFSDYPLASLFDIPHDPPDSREGLQKLLEDIIVSANVSILPIFLLKRRWYLRDEYPRWLRRLNLRARFTQLLGNDLLALFAVLAFVLFLAHVQVLGRGRGYW